MDPKTAAQPVIDSLESAWNAADGAAFGAPFASDADFVTIRGELHTGADAIAAGHQGIFDTIYKDSTVTFSLLQARELDDGVILAHVDSRLQVPGGPLAGDHPAVGTVVLVPNGEGHKITAYHNTLVAAG